MTLLCSMFTFYHIILSLFTFVSVKSQSNNCAQYNSYCLTGLSPDDYAAFIAAQYEYVGINEGCKYFQNTELAQDFKYNVYLHWDIGIKNWIIGSDISSTAHWALCNEILLDGCTNGKWTIFDGTNSNIKYSVTIKQCSYNNTQCESKYNINNNNNNSNSNDEYDYCIRKTNHRNINKGIAGSYSIMGCNEEKAYYKANDGSGVEGYDEFITSIAWDDQLSVWFMDYTHNITAHNAVAYCTFSNIETCSTNWYIYDGTEMTKDNAVISGYCNTCTDTKYDSYCIYGGLSRSDGHDIVGIYEHDGCVELMNSYKHNQYDEYYINNLSFGGNLTIQYECNVNSFLINNDYNLNKSYAVCFYQDDIMACSGNWSFYDAESDSFNVKDTIKSGSCDVIYEQCFDSDDVNADIDDLYLCVEADTDNDEGIADNPYYLEYIAGEYKYLDCDENGFPQFIRNNYNDGTSINVSWNNATMISFNDSFNVFTIHTFHGDYITDQYRHYFYCAALLIDICDTFWNIYDNITDEWIATPSVNITRGRCQYATEQTVSFWQGSGQWIIALIVLLILCSCFGALCVFCRKHRNNKRWNANLNDNDKKERYVPPKQVRAPSISESIETAGPIPTKPIICEPPPPYQQQYDNYMPAVPKQKSRYVFETKQGFEFDTRINFDLNDEPPEDVTNNAVAVIIERPVFDKKESIQIQQEFKNTIEVDGEEDADDYNHLLDEINNDIKQIKKIKYLPLKEWELRIDPVSNMKLLYNRVEKKNYWPWKYPQIARSLGLDMPNKPIFGVKSNDNDDNDDGLEMTNINDENNDLFEGQGVEHVTFAENDPALDVLMYNKTQ